ncbi:Arm DNA-binding domain-containing protein [Vibrio jasicida]|uniref:Arm DNA-binding domain-containing protein n=1 Tax=Vibrio jasicida TaxID=766224 RepID=UPI000CE444DA|nr:Arm DNA-binding domain-containing protein [Vibrio jasicida]
MAITNAFLKNKLNKPYDGQKEINDGNGLMVWISPKGKITFKIRYSHGGKQKRTKIGEYLVISLSEGRRTQNTSQVRPT